MSGFLSGDVGGDYDVVLGVFARRDFDDAQRRYASLSSFTFEQYIDDSEAVARSMISQGADVEICVLDLDEYDYWCRNSGLDAERTDSRAQFINAEEPESFVYEGSLLRVLDCEEANRLMEQAYDYIVSDDDRSDVVDALDEVCSSLMDDMAGEMQATALLTIEAVRDAPGLEEFGMSFSIDKDDDGDICLQREIDHEAISAMYHLALLRGGSVYLRTLQSNECVVHGYDLGAQRWMRGSAVNVAAWRGPRDHSVAIAGGKIRVAD
jgi:hypothetical protein